MKIKPLDERIAAKVGLSYYVTGFQDYLGARLLLNHNLLLQGATLASTAVEKYVKALFSSRKKRLYGHLNEWKKPEIASLTNELSLNADFFLLLQQVYKIRYIDDLKAPISFSIERLKFLLELDRTICILDKSIEFKRGDEIVNPYESGRLSGRQELIENNAMISGVSQALYLMQPDTAEAFYIDESLEIMSCVLTGWVSSNSSIFSTPGITRIGQTYLCQLSAPEA